MSTNPEANLMIKIPIPILFLMLLSSCNSQNHEPELEDVFVIIQPKLENNTTNSIKILFKGLKSSDSIYIEKVDGLEFNDAPAKSQTKIKGVDYLEYYTYVVPTKNGQIKLPEIKGISDSLELVAKARTVEVVDKLPKLIKEDFKLKLSSNKEKYSEKDTITITLYEYSKYYNVNKITLEKDSILALPKIEGKDNALTFKMESDIHKISGNKHLEDYLEDNFNVIDFDWDPFRSETIMEKLNDEFYLKTLLISVSLTPKQKGNYKIEPSQFYYYNYTSESDFHNSFEPTENGYRKRMPKHKIFIQSNALEFKVK